MFTEKLCEKLENGVEEKMKAFEKAKIQLREANSKVSVYQFSFHYGQ